MKLAPLTRRRFPHPRAGRHQRPRADPDHQGRALQFLERDRGRGPRRICRGSARSQRDGDRASARPQRSEAALAVIEGWDRWGGAFATSYSHDSHNLILYGHDAAELALAANTVIGMSGGIVVVKDRQGGRTTRLSGRGHALARSIRQKSRAPTSGSSRPRAKSAPGSRPTAPSRR